MIEKNREIWIGENRLYLDEDNILNIINIGEIDEKTAIEMKEAVRKLTNMVDGGAHTLTDLNKAGKTTSKARKIFQELADQGGTRKTALFGMHPVARVLASFVMGASKKEDMRFFKTKEEALAWIKE